MCLMRVTKIWSAKKRPAVLNWTGILAFII